MVVCFDKLSKGWPKVKGELVIAKVVESKNIKIYSPYVLYSYKVKGKIYRSDRIVFLGSGYRNKKQAVEELKLIQEAPYLSVYYFPIAPFIAVLQPNGSSRFMLFLIFIMSVVFFFAGIVSTGIL